MGSLENSLEGRVCEGWQPLWAQYPDRERVEDREGKDRMMEKRRGKGEERSNLREAVRKRLSTESVCVKEGKSKRKKRKGMERKEKKKK